MKKQLLSLGLAGALLFTGAAVCLTACGDGDDAVKCYYTIDVPEHLSVNLSSHNTDKDGKDYIFEGNTFDAMFVVEEGYEVDDELILKVDGKAVEWMSGEAGSWYAYEFTPTADFKIEVSGSLSEKYCNVVFERYTGFEEERLEGVYIKFPNMGAMSMRAFLSSDQATKRVRYKETVEFWVYTIGYTCDPNWAGFADGEFYHEDDKYGYHVETEITRDTTITFHGKADFQVSVSVKEDGSSWSYHFYNDQLDIRLDSNYENLIVTFKEEIPADVLAQLALEINGEAVAHTFTNGENVIALKPAYEYNNAAYPFQYNIDLNFYKFDFFDKVD